MSTSVRVTGTALDKIPLTTEALMRQVGQRAIVLIKQHTAAGIDREGVPFESYSPGYAKQKGRATGTLKVNLSLSNNMLESMTITKVTSKSVTIGFSR